MKLLRIEEILNRKKELFKKLWKKSKSHKIMIKEFLNKMLSSNKNLQIHLSLMLTKKNKKMKINTIECSNF